MVSNLIIAARNIVLPSNILFLPYFKNQRKWATPPQNIPIKCCIIMQNVT
jgi:hypothetical protein